MQISSWNFPVWISLNPAICSPLQILARMIGIWLALSYAVAALESNFDLVLFLRNMCNDFTSFYG